MHRRTFLRAAIAAAVAPLLHRPSSAAGPGRPNILCCVADDWSHPHAGAYGCNWVRTPAFDRVAREGVLFSNAYTPNAKCAPSRAAMLTGRNPWQLEEAANHWCFFPGRFTTFAEALPDHGYFVGFTGKGWSPGIARSADDKPRQLTGTPYQKRKLAPPTTEISGNDYAANFRDFLDQRPADRPFLFWYGGLEPHRGYEFGSGIARGDRTIADIDRVPGYWPDNSTVRTDMLDYALEVEHFDRHVGLMLAELERRGERDNTLVIVTSDNGMPFPRAKGYSYEQSNHMPMAMMWKAAAAPGRTVEDFVSHIDLAPTFLDLAGVSAADAGMQPMTGRSLVPLLRSGRSGRIDPQRDHVIIGKERNDVGRPQDQGYPIRGIIMDGWLYLRNFEPSRWPAGNPETGYLDTDGSPTKTACIQSRQQPQTRKFWDLCFGMRPAEELYNLTTDRDCVFNLAADPACQQTRRQLGDRLIKELKQQGDPRAAGNGRIFDEYPNASSERGFYERFKAGEKMKAGWVNPTDFDPGAAE